MPTLQPGPYALPGVRMPTWLVRFDKDGLCTSPATAAALIDHIGQSEYSNVLFYSHGWNTDFADAVDQYSRFLRAFEAVLAADPIPNFKPIFVGVTWPSVWMPSTPGPQMAAAAQEGDGVLALSRDSAVHDAMVREIGQELPESQRSSFYALVDAPSLDRDQALELASYVAPIVSRPPEEVDGDESEAIDAQEILTLASSLAAAERPAPASDDDDLDNFGMVAGSGGGVQAAGESWNPADVIKLASLYQMKDRAGRVGARGVADLLRKLLTPNLPPLHVFGHSFGAKVMLSALCAPADLPRKPASYLLLQPAISRLAFAANIPERGGPGGYHLALSRVASPIFTTFSSMNFPLHNVFHLALRRPKDMGELQIASGQDPYAALGGYGPGTSADHDPLTPIPGPDTPYPDLPGVKLIGLDGSNQRITSHGDVANRYTAWALRTQILRTL